MNCKDCPMYCEEINNGTLVSRCSLDITTDDNEKCDESKEESL